MTKLITYPEALAVAESVFNRTGTIARIRGDRAESLIYNSDIKILAEIFGKSPIDVVLDLKERVK